MYTKFLGAAQSFVRQYMILDSDPGFFIATKLFLSFNLNVYTTFNHF